MIPKFKLDEIVIADKYKRGEGIDLGRPKFDTAEILYKGEKAVNYDVGQKIFFDPSRGTPLDFYGQSLLILRENFIICEVTE